MGTGPPSRGGTMDPTLRPNKGDVKLSKEFWDKSFSDEDFVYGERENLFINHVSELIPKHAKVGCFAEGEGRNAVYLAKLGHDVTSYDQSVAGLDKTKALGSQHKVDVETVEMDVTKESAAENQYDAADMVFGHVPQQDQQLFIVSMIASDKTVGTIIFAEYSYAQMPYQTGGSKSLDMFYNSIDVLHLINDYKCIHFYYGEAERHEGKRHTGTGHVIQVVVRK